MGMKYYIIKNEPIILEYMYDHSYDFYSIRDIEYIVFYKQTRSKGIIEIAKYNQEALDRELNDWYLSYLTDDKPDNKYDIEMDYDCLIDELPF